MKNKLIILILVVSLFLMKEIIVDFVFFIHLFLNFHLRYMYIDDKHSSTGFWSDEQRKTHITNHNLKKYLLKYYKSKKAKKIIDLGCGTGEYVKFLKNNNINAIGVDNCDSCKNIEKWDLTKLYNNPADYVQSFEVGEHIPKKYESVFIKNICNNAKKGIILSWALPGQGGDGHVNEKSTKYIISMIEKNGFKLNERKTQEIRNHIGLSLRFLYFRHNLLIFDKIRN